MLYFSDKLLSAPRRCSESVIAAGLAAREAGDEHEATLQLSRAAQLAAVQEGTPRNGVVAAWSRLEEIAAETGLVRQRWETSAEFTARMLAGLPVDAAAARELGTLYRRARFSSHELTEVDRDRARAALSVLHEGLRTVSL